MEMESAKGTCYDKGSWDKAMQPLRIKEIQAFMKKEGKRNDF